MSNYVIERNYTNTETRLAPKSDTIHFTDYFNQPNAYKDITKLRK